MLLDDLLAITLFSGCLSLLANIAGAAIYDVRGIKSQAWSKRLRDRPLVSVLIVTFNDQMVIEQCLKAVSQSSYRSLEIVVVDLASRDETRQVVQKFIQKHPKKDINLHLRRSSFKPTSTIMSARRFCHGELILSLSPDQIVGRTAIAEAVREFNSRAQLKGLKLSLQTTATASTISLLAAFERLIGSRLLKQYDVFPAGAPGLAAPAMYRAGGRKNLVPTSYCSRAVVYSQPAKSLLSLVSERYSWQLERLQAFSGLLKALSLRSGLMSWLGLFLALCGALSGLLVPILVSYFIYLALMLHEPALLVASAAGLSLYLVFIIWGDDQLDWRQKLGYSLLLPITYLPLYLLSFVVYLVSLSTVLKLTGQLLNQIDAPRF